MEKEDKSGFLHSKPYVTESCVLNGMQSIAKQCIVS